MWQANEALGGDSTHSFDRVTTHSDEHPLFNSSVRVIMAALNSSLSSSISTPSTLITTTIDQPTDLLSNLTELLSDAHSLVNHDLTQALVDPSSASSSSVSTSAQAAEAESFPYFGEYFWEFKRLYSPIHGYLSLSLCAFGTIANILNVIVLSQ